MIPDPADDLSGVRIEAVMAHSLRVCSRPLYHVKRRLKASVMLALLI